MYRFYVSADQLAEKEVFISGGDVNHIKNVLRLEVGDWIVACDGNGTDYVSRIQSICSDEVVASIEKVQPTGTELPVRITLFQGMPKKDKLELIIQKAVELGAARVVPVAMNRCVVQLSAKDGAKKQERWQKIAREACKQSGRCQMMAVDAPIAFPALLAALKTHEAAIVPWEDARGYSLTAFHREHPEIHDLAIVIGPEGGMSADEIARMKDCGCQSVTLGPRILRTETAGLCALSALFCLYGELE